MIEKPILFSTEMVKAILDGRKSQTRRIIKTHTLKVLDCAAAIGEISQYLSESQIIDKNNLKYILSCSPYKIGMRLWVRETWALDSNGYHYKADNCIFPKELGGWHPSIFMPKEASRITLEITDIRVERLWDITEDDACRDGGFIYSSMYVDDKNYAKNRFKILWDSINLKRGYCWDSNPWTWVISFKRI